MGKVRRRRGGGCVRCSGVRRVGGVLQHGSARGPTIAARRTGGGTGRRPGAGCRRGRLEATPRPARRRLQARRLVRDVAGLARVARSPDRPRGRAIAARRSGAVEHRSGPQRGVADDLDAGRCGFQRSGCRSRPRRLPGRARVHRRRGRHGRQLRGAVPACPRRARAARFRLGRHAPRGAAHRGDGAGRKPGVRRSQRHEPAAHAAAKARGRQRAVPRRAGNLERRQARVARRSCGARVPAAGRIPSSRPSLGSRSRRAEAR